MCCARSSPPSIYFPPTPIVFPHHESMCGVPPLRRRFSSAVYLPTNFFAFATLGSILDSKRRINLAQLVSPSVALLAELVSPFSPRSFSLLPSSAPAQLNSTSTQTKAEAEVSLNSTFSSHPPTRPPGHPSGHPATRKSRLSQTFQSLLDQLES